MTSFQQTINKYILLLIVINDEGSKRAIFILKCNFAINNVHREDMQLLAFYAKYTCTGTMKVIQILNLL